MPATNAPNQPIAAAANSGRFFPCGGKLLLLFAGYYILQILVRVTCSGSVDLDESEAVVHSQVFSWGYGSAPPLYTWLQMGVFAVFGKSVLGLSVLKNLLLFSTCMLTFASARVVTRWEPAAVAASLSLLLLPSFAWESQRDLTHSVLSSTAAVGTLFCFLQVLSKPGPELRWYVLLGVCGGLGLLSKYNYALWFVGLLLAAVSMNQFRARVLDARMLLTLFIVLLIFLPNGWWILHHRELAFITSSKFEVKQSISTWQTFRVGSKNVFQSLLSFAGPISLIYFLLFWRRPDRADIGSTPTPRFDFRILLLRTWLWILALVFYLILIAHATGLKERWFQPILIALPVLGISFVQKHLTPFRLKLLLGLALFVMTAVALIMPGRLWMAERLHREEPLTRPYPQLAAALKSAVQAESLVICDTRHLAGNLKLGLSEATCISPELMPLFPGKYAHCYLAWDARKQSAMPESLVSWAKSRSALPSPAASPQFFAAPYRFHSSKEFKLGFLQLY